MQRASHSSRARHAHRGFTLLELMITLALAAVVAAIAVPNLRTFSQNNRLTAASNDLLRSYQIARSEAIKRQQNVVVCASSAPAASAPTCSYGEFGGWIVFVDDNGNWQRDSGEVLLEQHDLIESSVSARTDNDGIGSFNSTGFANPAGTKAPTRNVVFCDVRGVQQVGTGATGRAVLIAQSGRVRVTRDYSEVSSSLSITGDTCP